MMATQIMQWNINGIFKHVNELKLLTDKFHPLIITLQETLLKPTQQFNLKNYNIYRQDYTDNIIASGGVATLIHNSVAKQSSIKIQTNLQVVTISVLLCGITNIPITICNVC